MCNFFCFGKYLLIIFLGEDGQNFQCVFHMLNQVYQRKHVNVININNNNIAIINYKYYRL